MNVTPLGIDVAKTIFNYLSTAWGRRPRECRGPETREPRQDPKSSQSRAYPPVGAAWSRLLHGFPRIVRREQSAPKLSSLRVFRSPKRLPAAVQTDDTGVAVRCLCTSSA